MPEVQDPNPNTPRNWDQRWKDIGLSQHQDTWVQARLDRVATLVPSGVTVLDLAAGAATIRHKLTHVAKYVPIDFSAQALQLAGVPGIQADCIHVPVHDGQYHTVLAMEILEHLDDPYPLVREALRISCSQVIITVPNDRLPPHEFRYHRRTWTQQQLSDFLTTFPDIAFVTFFQAPVNVVAQCTLQERTLIL